MDLLGGYGSDGSSADGSAPNGSQDVLQASASTIIRMNAAPAPSILVSSKSLKRVHNMDTACTALAIASGDASGTAVSKASDYAVNTFADPIQGPSLPVDDSTFKQTAWGEGNVGAAGVYERVRERVTLRSLRASMNAPPLLVASFRPFAALGLGMGCMCCIALLYFMAWHYNAPPHSTDTIFILSCSLPTSPNKFLQVVYDSATFDQNYNEYNATGKAIAPESGDLIDVNSGASRTGMERHLPIKRPAEMVEPSSSSSAAAATAAGNGKKRKKKSKGKKAHVATEEDLEGDDGQFGIWGKPSHKEINLMEDSLTDLQRGELNEHQITTREEQAEKLNKKNKVADDADEMAFDRLVERKMAHLLPPRLEEGAKPKVATTKFHGAAMYDYQGRSWIAPPAGLHPSDDHTCYIPTKCAHTFNKAHEKGVHAVRFSPITGHLLLSAGLDGKVKCWDVKRKKLMRVYDGHTAGVRDICFNNDGSKFLSASFDRWIRLWDTETGECLNTFTSRRVPYCIKFYPRDDNFFVVGQSDNKVVTFNATTGEITQEYNHHLAAVNSVTFTEDARKLVTTSDDKKILVWEWDIGAPAKYISEPDMHSMPAVTLHPKADFFAAQSLDNEIKVYAASDRYQLVRKKKFKGHQVAGFACQMTFAPSGKFLASGDGNGKLYFWDWNSGRSYARFNAHQKGPAIGCEWSPTDPCLVATCGWDGCIKFWSN